MSSHAAPPRRKLAQPGPASPDRLESRAGTARMLDFTLEPGLTINEAVTRPLLQAGIAGGVVEIEGGALGPFTYVLPASSPDRDHAAFYSRFYRIDTPSLLDRASISAGWRDGAPFIHCHGVWTEPDGSRRAGHVIPSETVIAAPVRASAWGLTDATFVAEADPETNFTLFRPMESAIGTNEVGASGILARVRPNEDVCEAVEALCARHGLTSATVRGIGSLVGAEFTDGRTVRSYASEVLITRGRVEPDERSRPSATLDIAMVDMDGIIHEGRLVRGRNSVCITFEIYLE
ncbi:DUF296 domain-containing protein (plasmid) [Skermanella rosea]|uniref:PCC domain-containing protein n=1 Tax=Skermanella rosea TaxID=1817965 RepID=UPI001932C522|nr:DUF296 domain-containing protein [Skermanella rosea]UEM07947.1 DUF296 domain-containing protein [Skermanella rosea]